MIELKVINTDAKVVGNIELTEEVFAVENNIPLVHQVVVALLANRRQGTKSTLTRTEVRGGGIKPWRQKGTGRARQGSIRAPQWIKGGVVFAPKPRDFSKKINKKMRAGAMRCVLSEKVRSDEFVVVDKFEIAEAKTKLVAAILAKIDAGKRPILVTNGNDEQLVRAARNIEGLVIADVNLVNVYELVSCGKCIIAEDAVKKLMEVYA